MKNKENPLLNQKSYEKTITSQPEFHEAMDNKEPLRRAIGSAALSAAETYKPHTFEHNILNTLGNMEDFFDAQKNIDGLRAKYKTAGIRNIPENERPQYLQSRETVTHFNHVLRDTVEASINEDISYADLEKLISDQHNKVSGNMDPAGFKNMVHTTIDGMRNELATEMILINNGVEFEQGSEEDDSKGGDFMINGVPIDIKSGEKNAENKKYEAQQRGFNADTIIWSQIKFEDFAGRLSLDPETEAKKAAKLLPLIDQAAGTNYAESLDRPAA